MRRITLKKVLSIGCCTTMMSGSFAPAFALVTKVHLSGAVAGVPGASAAVASNLGTPTLVGGVPSIVGASALISAPAVIPGALAAPISPVPSAPAKESADSLGAAKDLSDRLTPAVGETFGDGKTAAVSGQFFDQTAPAGAEEVMLAGPNGGGSNHVAGNNPKVGNPDAELADLIERVGDSEIKTLLQTMKMRGEWRDDENVRDGKVLHFEKSMRSSAGQSSSWVADLSWSPVRHFAGLRVLREDNTVEVPGVVWDYHAAVYHVDTAGVLQSAWHERRASKYTEERHPISTDTPEARQEFSSLMGRLYEIFSASGFAELIKKMAPYGALNHLEYGGGKISGEQLLLKKTPEGSQFLEVAVGDSVFMDALGRHTQEDKHRIYAVSMSEQLLSALDKRAIRIIEDSQENLPPGPARNSEFRDLLRQLMDGLAGPREMPSAISDGTKLRAAANGLEASRQNDAGIAAVTAAYAAASVLPGPLARPFVNRLVSALGSSNENARSMAGMFLVKLGKKAYGPLLDSAKAGQNAAVALAVLGSMEDVSLIPQIEPFLKSSDPSVVKAAQDAIRILSAADKKLW
jgi:hypothetical protein